MALEAGYQTGEKPVTAELVETVLSRQLDDLEPTFGQMLDPQILVQVAGDPRVQFGASIVRRLLVQEHAELRLPARTLMPMPHDCVRTNARPH